MDSHYFTKMKDSKKSQDVIKEVSVELNRQIILANAGKQQKVLEALLQSVFVADSASIEYLTTFSNVLRMSLEHTKKYSERVNFDLLQTRLLRSALNQMVDQDMLSMHEFSDFSEKRLRPVNVYLGNSDDEDVFIKRGKYELGRGMNPVVHAMKGARNELRNIAVNDGDNSFNSDSSSLSASTPALVNVPVSLSANSDSSSHFGVVGYSNTDSSSLSASMPPAPPKAPTKAPAMVYHEFTPESNTYPNPTSSGGNIFISIKVFIIIIY